MSGGLLGGCIVKEASHLLAVIPFILECLCRPYDSHIVIVLCEEDTFHSGATILVRAQGDFDAEGHAAEENTRVVNGANPRISLIKISPFVERFGSSMSSTIIHQRLIPPSMHKMLWGC